MEVELIVEKQKDPFLVLLSSEKSSEIFVESVSTSCSPLSFLTANLPPCLFS